MPEAWITKIFQELQGNYGSKFINKWKIGQALPDGQDAGIVNAKRVWAEKLAGFSDQPEAIGEALRAMPDEVPDLPAFLNLCREAAKRLNSEKPLLEHHMTQEEIARADEVARKVKEAFSRMPERDHKAWAKELKEQHEKGEPLAFLQIKMYREALGING